MQLAFCLFLLLMLQYWGSIITAGLVVKSAAVPVGAASLAEAAAAQDATCAVGILAWTHSLYILSLKYFVLAFAYFLSNQITCPLSFFCLLCSLLASVLVVPSKGRRLHRTIKRGVLTIP